MLQTPVYTIDDDMFTVNSGNMTHSTPSASKRSQPEPEKSKRSAGKRPRREKEQAVPPQDFDSVSSLILDHIDQVRGTLQGFLETQRGVCLCSKDCHEQKDALNKTNDSQVSRINELEETLTRIIKENEFEKKKYDDLVVARNAEKKDLVKQCNMSTESNRKLLAEITRLQQQNNELNANLIEASEKRIREKTDFDALIGSFCD